MNLSKTKKALFQEREKLLIRLMKVYKDYNHSIIKEFIRLCTEWELDENRNYSLSVFVEAHEKHPL